jgi:hypothetical protein
MLSWVDDEWVRVRFIACPRNDDIRPSLAHPMPLINIWFHSSKYSLGGLLMSTALSAPLSNTGSQGARYE